MTTNTLPQDYEAIITPITQRLSAAYLHITRAFDLKSACVDQPSDVCPHHGTAPCDCQMTVLLIYCPSSASVTLTVRRCDGPIQFSMVHPSSKRPDPQLETIILQALVFDHVQTEL